MDCEQKCRISEGGKESERSQRSREVIWELEQFP